MKSYTEFCSHYCLDPNSEEARQQYRDYRVNAEVLQSAVKRKSQQAVPDETRPKRPRT